ncbi:UPF0496 protein At2g18630-like [Gossypium arboreum]|uniref:Uncharacterized protein n=1 Tax=Gossypium arboreum TaxID=29729 RepID=A0ABR0QWH9_GOSAR|nr:UPF0496 protein At2g18630-like [Gossypium arboreum]KAK5843690.1 hypothetical protein PVK06_006148 [Gossypium arboreum]
MIASSGCPERSLSVAESSLYREVFGHGSTPQERIDLVNDILAVDSDLDSLVKEYYGNFEKTFEFCTALKDCLERARNNHGIIESAVKFYDEEDKLEVETNEKKSVKALKELRRFKAAEEPFVEELLVLKGAARRRQESMQGELRARRGTLKKKLESLETWRRVWDALFVAAFISALVFSVVAAALSVKPVVTALASALTVAIAPAWKRCDEHWNRNEAKVKRQKKLTNAMEFFAPCTIKIWVGVERLEIEITSLMRTIDFVLGEEYVLKFAMDEINENSIHIAKTVTDLLWEADNCGCNIRTNWDMILWQMIDNPWEL